MSETTTTNQDPFYILYQTQSERTLHYAGLIGFGIGTLKNIIRDTTDENTKIECEKAIKYLHDEFYSKTSQTPF